MKIIHGDSREELKKLIDQGIQVDSIVTDPPYAIEFLNKKWDTGDIVHDVEFWKLCLQILKPGGHMLAFSATRTYHRMTCAIEDAGFEIRDCIRYMGEMHYPAYVYGQGFPKSLNIKKSAEKQSICCICKEKPLPYDHYERAEQKTKYDLRSLQSTNISSSISNKQTEEEIMFSSLSEQDVSNERSASMVRYENGKESSLERRSDLFQEQGQLHGSALREMSKGISSNGTEGRLYNGTSPCDGNENREIVNEGGSGESQRSQSIKQQYRESRAISNECRSQEGRGWEICSGCSKPIIPEGLGTALKPAWEPVVIARAPLSEKTIVENVLKHGVAGLNIDGCRVATNETWAYNADKNGTTFHGSVGERIKQTSEKKGSDTIQNNPLGRFPANVIHSGSEEVEAEFAKYGERKTGSINPGIYKGKASDSVARGHFNGWDNQGYTQSIGSASRFFYSAKASKHDRMGSKHPTVKPINLMRYLCRLVTPQNGKVLDPFAGSGTTGHAAILEGFTPILIEREDEYYNDILRRIEYVQNHKTEEEKENSKQMRLFDELV